MSEPTTYKLRELSVFYFEKVKYEWLLFLALLIFQGVFTWLAGASWSIAGYGFLLQTVLVSIYYVLKFRRYVQKMRHREELLVRDFNVNDWTDTTVHSEEQLLLEKIDELNRHLYKQHQNLLDAREEQMDYFILWLHQIKTPIAAMKLLIETGQLADELKRQLELALIQLEDYTHMALNYLKIDNPDRNLEIEQVAVDGVIKDVLKKYAPLFIYKKLTLDYQDLNETVLSDAKWLSIILEQIIGNSLKYTDKGTIRITAPAPNQLMISDTGIGIRSEDLPKIFERGYSGYDGRRLEKSTGLGLFLVQKICKHLGHTVRVDSTYGEGTTVIIDCTPPSLKIYN